MFWLIVLYKFVIFNETGSPSASQWLKGDQTAYDPEQFAHEYP